MPDTFHCPHCGNKIHYPDQPRKKKKSQPPSPSLGEGPGVKFLRSFLTLAFLIIFIGLYYATQIAPGLTP